MSILNYNQSFRFCGYDLSGVSDLTYSSEFGVGFTPTLTSKSFGFHKVGPSVGRVEFSRSLIYADPVIGYTGESPCSGVFSYNGVSYGFESGYLESYSVSCGVGQVPAVGASISVFGEMKTGAATHTGVTHPDIFVPSPRSIVITNDYNSTSRINSFNWSITSKRDPKYSVGSSLLPDAVLTQTPLQISASATFNVAGFSPLDVQQFVRYVYAPSFTINIKNRDLSSTLMSLPVHNAQILSQSIQGTVDSPLSLTLEYGGYLE